jgi:Transcriptional regulator, AbiEi antitoxin, Type IV TA system
MKEQEIVSKIKDELERTLRDIPFIELRSSVAQASLRGIDIDLLLELKIRDNSRKVVVEVKSLGEPRVIRGAIQQLREYLDRTEDVYPMVAAPYISDDTGRVCRKSGVGYIDLAGNLLFNFDQVYIERKNYPNPAIEKRQARSIFSPKASRIMRVVLSNPGRLWRVQELAREARVSLGLASRLKDRLLDLEYAVEKENGLSLSRPGELLEQWANNYSFRKNKLYDCFSLEEIKELERNLSQYCEKTGIPYALTLFSGAALVAPYARYTRGFAYVGKDITKVADSLGLKRVSSGPNFSMLEPYDEGVFYGGREIDGMRVVSDVQLYLDLVGFKGRGDESAEFLFEQRIKPQW